MQHDLTTIILMGTVVLTDSTEHTNCGIRTSKISMTYVIYSLLSSQLNHQHCTKCKKKNDVAAVRDDKFRFWLKNCDCGRIHNS